METLTNHLKNGFSKSKIRSLYAKPGAGIWILSAILLLTLSLVSCSDDSVEPGIEEGETEIIKEVNVELPVDAGEVGLVIDTREIFRKGYPATKAVVAFPEHQDFDTTLQIDPVTNLAILRIPNEDLSEDQKAAFAAGIATEIIIRDEGQTILTEYAEEKQVLDNANAPLSLHTDLPYIMRPLNLKKGIPYLLQPKDSVGVLTSIWSDVYHTAELIHSGSPTQQFYFTKVEGATDTYVVEHLGYSEGTFWYLDPGANWLNLGGPGGIHLPNGPQEFVFEQGEDGWIRIRDAGTVGNYLTMIGDVLKFSGEEPHQRFRLISDNITWNMDDHGTVYHKPIIPPAQIDFAYEATIRNCSSGTLTETVGNAKSRTSIKTTATSESLQLFSSEEESFGLNIGLEVGGELYGATASINASANFTYTTSKTTSTENSFSTTTEETIEVSRSRSLEIPSFTGIEVYDAVRTVKDARVPFTQVLRVRASYKKDGTALTGSEIMTQLQFNFVSGMPSEIGNDYVDITLRGQAHIDQMFEVETGANELPGACD